MPAEMGRRARSYQEFEAKMLVFAELEPQRFRPIETQPGDVFISSWVKSGTTMMQQMFHQLRMAAATGNGDMDFDDITRMTPWEDSAVVIDYDPNVPQRASPRGFKSHREYERLPAGACYIVTLRDPHETFVSLHRFYDGWVVQSGAIPLEDFLPFWLAGGPNGCDYFTHLLSWYARRNEPDTLLANYGWAAMHRTAMIRRMAKFLGIGLTPEIAAIVERMTSREFMYAHRDRFDEAMLAEAFAVKLGIPDDSDSTKVQEVGSDAKCVPRTITEQIDAMWAERVEPVTGHADFASLARELDAALAEPTTAS